MGNTTSNEQEPETEQVPVSEPELDEESVAASLIQKKWKNQKTDFQWHDHLYDELLEMMETSEMVFYMVHLFKAVRQQSNEEESIIKGLDLVLPSESSEAAASTGTNKLFLAQIISIVETNQTLLEKSKDFTVKPEDMLDCLKRIRERTSPRKVSLVGLDPAKLKKQDMPYFLVKDDKLKRITLVFPWTNNDNDDEYKKEWITQTKIKLVKVPLPRALKAKVSGDRITDIGVHSGFHSYLFEQKSSTTNKFDEIVNSIKPILANNPKHRLFVTGHGIGAAISQLVAFFLTFNNNDGIPLPISSIAFSTPRVGDANYWRAAQLLEIAGKLRTCRVVLQDTDSMPLYPSNKEYVHAGHQVSFPAKTGPPKASYPTPKHDGIARVGRFGKKPKDYKTTKDYLNSIEKNKDALMDMHLNKLYEDIGVSSFVLKKEAAVAEEAATNDSDHKKKEAEDSVEKKEAEDSVEKKETEESVEKKEAEESVEKKEAEESVEKKETNEGGDDEPAAATETPTQAESTVDAGSS